MKKLLFLFVLSICCEASRAETWTVINVNQGFVPDSILIFYGDTVVFQLDLAYNAQEVSQATWLANDSVPVTGFQTPQGGGMMTGLTPGSHYYVSDSNAYVGMKGFIYVLPPASVQFAGVYDSVLETADSAMIVINVNNPSGDAVTYTVEIDTNHTTAMDSMDYIFTNVTFTDTGAHSLDTVYVYLVDNPFIQSTKTITFNLVGLSSNTLHGADSAYTVYILNNDTLAFSFLGAAFSYPQADTTVYIGIAKSSPVPYNDTLTVVLDPGNAVQGVNFNCPDTIEVYFPADVSLTDSTDTVYFPVQLLYDSTPVGNTQANFRILPPNGNAQLGISAFTLFIIGQASSGIEGLITDDDVRMFPNPVKDRLSIVTDVAWQQVRIIDILGEEVINAGEFSAGNHEVDMTLLPAGIYIVNMQSGQSSYIVKLVKM